MTTKAIPIPLFIILPFLIFICFNFYFSIASQSVAQPDQRACQQPCQDQKNDYTTGDNTSHCLDTELSKFLEDVGILEGFHIVFMSTINMAFVVPRELGKQSWRGLSCHRPSTMKRYEQGPGGNGTVMNQRPSSDFIMSRGNFSHSVKSAASLTDLANDASK